MNTNLKNKIDNRIESRSAGDAIKSRTYTVQADIKASTALIYETGGNADCDLACCVDKVSNDVTPNVTRAGAASGLIQNEIH